MPLRERQEVQVVLGVQKTDSLKSFEQQTGVVEQEWQTQRTVIKTEPANSQVVYVPAYNPAVVAGLSGLPGSGTTTRRRRTTMNSRALTRLCHRPCVKLRHTEPIWTLEPILGQTMPVGHGASGRERRILLIW